MQTLCTINKQILSEPPAADCIPLCTKLDLQNNHKISKRSPLTLWTRTALSVWQIATGWTVWGSNASWGEIFRIRLGGHPVSYKIDTLSLSRG